MIFHLHQRIRVTEKKHPLYGRAGLVVQLRRGDRGAFIEMDRALPAKFPRLFNVESRARWVVVQPGEAEEETC